MIWRFVWTQRETLSDFCLWGSVCVASPLPIQRIRSNRDGDFGSASCAPVRRLTHFSLSRRRRRTPGSPPTHHLCRSPFALALPRTRLVPSAPCATLPNTACGVVSQVDALSPRTTANDHIKTCSPPAPSKLGTPAIHLTRALCLATRLRIALERCGALHVVHSYH